MSATSSPVLPHALDLPIFRYLKDKRVVLASSSVHRKERLGVSGLNPEVIPSTFPENLPHSDFAHAPSEYPVATSQEKAMEVYQRLLAEDPQTAPGLVISGDTVVIFYPQSPVNNAIEDFTVVDGTAIAKLEMGPEFSEEMQDFGKGFNKGNGRQDWGGCEGRKGLTVKILEKPLNKEAQYETLMELNGQKCEIVTGVTIGMHLTLHVHSDRRTDFPWMVYPWSIKVYPIAAAPGYELRYGMTTCVIASQSLTSPLRANRSIAVSTLVQFNDNSPELIKAYVEKGEGVTRCGGFSTRGLGGFLVKSVQGDYDNVTGFPTAAFWRWMRKLYEEGVFSQ
ncbi:hypothetical protein QFC22_002955 [Naganishia vaughanmartiniae]|uniref:Uncharacterized protein n=1 Tax=Naganishia vaughanmartiniae TaxID=1424756 RepID=A0ACC2X8E6_9TREE|nr:hypothetical protein QFC22_002955 [Naganishia vaughanmartiniae]